MALLIRVVGEVEEMPSGGLRSFDRNFVVVPAPEGSA